MSNGLLNDEHPMDTALPPRVSALEVGVRTLSNEMESVKTSIDRLSSNVVSGFAEIRRDSASSGRTNWGWVIAGVAVLIALVGSVGTAWFRPLQAFDEQIEVRLSAVEKRSDQTTELSIRTDERLRIYRELDVPIPSPHQSQSR